MNTTPKKQLPKRATWVVFEGFARGTTEADIVEYLNALGFQITADAVSMGFDLRRPNCVVAFQPEDVLAMLNGFIGDSKLNGVTPKTRATSPRPEPRAVTFNASEFGTAVKMAMGLAGIADQDGGK